MKPVGEMTTAATRASARPILQPARARLRRITDRRHDRDDRDDRDGLDGNAPAATIRRDAVYRRMLVAADILAAATSMAITGIALAPDLIGPAALVCLPVLVLGAKTMGLYDRDELVLHKTTLEDAPRVFQLTALTTLVLTMTSGALHQSAAAPTRMVLLWALLLILMLTARTTARRIARAVTPKERCVLVGQVEREDRVRRILQLHPELGAELVASIPFDRATARGEDSEEFGEYLTNSNFHRVIVTHADAGSGDMLDAIRVFKARGIKVSVLPTLFDVLGSAVVFDHVAGETLLGLRRYGLTRSSRLLKRAADVAVSAVALVLIAPLLAAIALVIRLESPGPALFRQTRVGRAGRRFRIIKFRTMVADAQERRDDLHALNETEGVFKLADDPRVTRVGRRLRRMSLDELPQLLNVLRGEMSLVGPRPLILAEDSRVDGWRRQRLDLTPGMTGAWQILGWGRIPLEEMVALDYLYIVNWSLWADLQILLRTIPHVLGRRGL